MAMITIVKSQNPLILDNGDIVSVGNEHEYLEKFEDHQGVIPLAVIHPHWHRALTLLEIDQSPLDKAIYRCPYTGFDCFTMVPAALITTDVKRYLKQVKRCGGDYMLDHEFHRHMYKERVFELSEIGGLLMGSGYYIGGISDGSKSRNKGLMNLSNGDKLCVYFWEWYNK